MEKAEITKDMVQAFIMHPDWRIMQKYIEEHFENSTHIDTINVDNPSTTVHAEVIARQRIDADVKSLVGSFETLRTNFNKKKITYE